jgi:hypothetical protein
MFKLLKPSGYQPAGIDFAIHRGHFRPRCRMESLALVFAIHPMIK